MFKFWGDGSQESMDLVNAIRVRSTENFNWTFIFILAVVFYVYWTEVHKKNYEVVYAGFALYGVHWLYEICNAIIGKVFGYPLWSVSNESTTFILLIGVCWELSMMFSLAGMISFKMMPQDRSKRYLVGKLGKNGDTEERIWNNCLKKQCKRRLASKKHSSTTRKLANVIANC